MGEAVGTSPVLVMTLKKLPWKQIVAWTVFAAAFGYTEAALVVYLRRLLGEAPGMDYRQVFGARGMTLSSAAVAADMKAQGVWSLERSREAATLVLLFGAAWAGGRTARERGAVFSYTFAVWDLTYYGFLAVWTGFPRTLSAVDIYFLLPWASFGPVWFPVLVVMPALVALAFYWWRPRPEAEQEPFAGL